MDEYLRRISRDLRGLCRYATTFSTDLGVKW